MRFMKQVSPWITNNPVTMEDTNTAINIFGPDVDTAKGKGSRQKSNEIIDDYIEIPSQLYENNRVILCIDIIYINKCIFLTGIDKSIRYRSCVPLNSRRGEEITRSFNLIMRLYNKAHYYIKQIYCDGEFSPVLTPFEC